MKKYLVLFFVVVLNQFIHAQVNKPIDSCSEAINQIVIKIGESSDDFSMDQSKTTLFGLFNATNSILKISNNALEKLINGNQVYILKSDANYIFNANISVNKILDYSLNDMQNLKNSIQALSQICQ